MKNESDPMAQADRIISGLPKAQPLLTYDNPNWGEPRILRQELLKAYNQGVQDEAQRIAQVYDNDQENDIF